MHLFVQGVNETKTITSEQLNNIVTNLATFMDYIILENSSPAWTGILSQFDIFFRRLPALLQSPCDMDPILKIMISVLRIPSIVSAKARHEFVDFIFNKFHFMFIFRFLFLISHHF